MEVERSYASRGVGNAGLTTGIIGTSLAGLLALGGGLLGGVSPAAAAAASSGSDSGYVNRYEAKQAARIAELETEVKLRDANTYTDGKLLEVYQYVDGRLRNVEGQISQQAVYNATNTAALNCMQGQIAQLMSLTKLVVPNGSICPGWGAATVSVTPSTTTA